MGKSVYHRCHPAHSFVIRYTARVVFQPSADVNPVLDTEKGLRKGKAVFTGRKEQAMQSASSSSQIGFFFSGKSLRQTKCVSSWYLRISRDKRSHVSVS